VKVRLLVAILMVLVPAFARAQDQAVTIPVELEALPLDKKIALAKAGDDVAKMAVGEAYEEGKGTRPDLAAAAKWYREAALNNNLEAQYRLAKIVATGADGLRQDLPTALKLLELAAGKGHAGAQYEYARAIDLAKVLDKGPADAKGWYEKSADQGFAPAETSLGMIYLFPRTDKPDAKKAAHYLEKAATHGDAWGMNDLGGLYEQGWGVHRDVAKAKALYAQAATKGVAPALTNLKRLEAAGN
jgi:TPR repeat protein